MNIVKKIFLLSLIGLGLIITTDLDAANKRRREDDDSATENGFGDSREEERPFQRFLGEIEHDLTVVRARASDEYAQYMRLMSEHIKPHLEARMTDPAGNNILHVVITNESLTKFRNRMLAELILYHEPLVRELILQANAVGQTPLFLARDKEIRLFEPLMRK